MPTSRLTRLLILLLQVGLAVAQSTDEQVAIALRNEIAAKKIPGGVVAVLSGTQTICIVAAGTSDTKSQTPVTTDMLFRLGSTTKMFTATTALILADEKRLDLHAPIRKYLPHLPPLLGSISLHQLLTHTAGLYDEAPMYGPPDDSALSREIAGWSDDRLFLEPGTSFSYSNPGYWLVGRVLEAVEGNPFAEVVRERLLQPLGMTHSTFRPEIAMGSAHAAGHDRDQEVIDPPANHAGTWPSGSLYSTAPELLRFATALLNDGVLNGKRVIPAAVVRALLQPSVLVKGLPGTSYGYGLIFKTYRGEPVAYHTGARLGYGSIIDFAPEKKVAVIVLGNRTGALLTGTVRVGFESQFPLLQDEEETSTGGRYITQSATMEQFSGRFVNHSPIEAEIYERWPLGFLPFGTILTLKKGFERIPIRIIDDTTASNGYQQVVFTLGPDRRIQLLHIEMHTLKRVSEAN